MNRKFIIISFFLVFLIGCDKNVHRIIKHQNEILLLSRYHDIISDEVRNLHVLRTYSPDSMKINEYFFDVNDQGKETIYTLFRDSIQFNPDVITGIDRNSDNYQEKICSYYLFVSQILELYEIKSISNIKDKIQPYVKVRIIMNNGDILLYGLDEEMSKDESISKYYKRVGKGWYI